VLCAWDAMTAHDTTSLADRAKQRLMRTGGADCDMIYFKNQAARQKLTSCNSSLARAEYTRRSLWRPAAARIVLGFFAIAVGWPPAAPAAPMR
jgi:hypothetical protein